MSTPRFRVFQGTALKAELKIGEGASAEDELIFFKLAVDEVISKRKLETPIKDMQAPDDNVTVLVEKLKTPRGSVRLPQ